MIVPRDRLLWVAGIAGIPLVTLLAMGSIFTLIGVVGLALLAGIAAADALVSRRNLDGITVLLAGRINLFKARPAEIEIRILNDKQNEHVLRLGVNLPPVLATDREDAVVQLPAGAAESIIKWPATPRERGSFRIPSVHLEIGSKLGLWSVRHAQKTNVEVRVYPDLLSERKRVAMIFLRRHSFGIHAQRQVGKGRDFEKLREYLHGDPLEDVHWKATAKRGRPVTKVFQIERTQEVYVVIDSSRLTARRSNGTEQKATLQSSGETSTPHPDPLRLEGRGEEAGNTTVLDRFLTAALLLALATEQQGDHFGLVTFSDKVHQVIRAKNGQAHFGLCRDALYDLQPRLVTPDFDELCSTIRVRLRKRALIVFLTSLDDPIIADSFVRASELLSRQHLVLVNMIEPGGTKPVFDRHAVAPQTGRDLYRALAGHMAWQRLREMQKTLEMRGMKFSVLPNEMLARELVGQYLDVKQRQVL